MGRLGDVLGNALGANQINNGFKGNVSSANSLYPLPSASGYSAHYSRGRGSRSGSPYNSNYGDPYGSNYRTSPSYDYDNGRRPPHPHVADDRYPNDKAYFNDLTSQFDTRYGRQSPYRGSSSLDEPPPYDQSCYNGPLDPQTGMQGGMQRSVRRTNTNDIRLFALPQIEYSEGAPFLRGYSHELNCYGISEEQFIRIIDKINIANIPSPENQIFQKAAGIAGFFIPGAGAAALIGSQVVAGFGAHAGKKSVLAKALSRANLDVFLPAGLEICIGKQAHVAQEAGLPYTPSMPYHSTPEEKVASFGNSLAPLDAVYPPDYSQGRQDPIAKLGNHFGEKKGDKELAKADKELAKMDRDRERGKLKDKDMAKAEEKMQKLDDGLQWLMVRTASPNATEAWRQTLRESEAAIAQTQREQQMGGR